jgi:hypothetical protein
MHITDTEAMLLMQSGQDRRYAATQIHIANAEIRRLAGLLRAARADLADVEEELKRERAARLLAEYNLNKRH